MKSFILLLAMSLNAFAQMDFPMPNMSKVKADLRCEDEGGGIAIQLPKGNSKAKIWQVEKGEAQGLEVNVVEFNVMRCPGCFNFKYNLDLGDQSSKDAVIQGSVVNYHLTLKVPDGSSSEVVEKDCRPVVKKRALGK